MDVPPPSTTPPQADRLSLTVIGLCIAGVALLSFRIIRTLSAPLSALPGTFLSKWTSLPLRLATAFGERHRYVHALHARYGPIIRVSPSEVSITGASSVKQLYRMGGNFSKSRWYRDFTGNQPTPSMFAIVGNAEHGVRRRLVAHQFTERAIRALEPEVIAKGTRLAVEGMAREMKSEGFVDVFKWFVLMANDVVCEASFAENFGLSRAGEKTEFTLDIVNFARRSVFRTQLRLINRIWAFFSREREKNTFRVFKRLAGYSGQSFERYERHLKENPENAKPTLLSKLFASIEDGKLTREQVRREGVGYIIAGTDTTANASTYAVWLLSQNPAYERLVREQVATLPDDFTDDQLVRLPALCNAIAEVLRLRSPVGQALLRTVGPEGVQMGDFFIPGGSEIGAPAWTLHRDPTVWPRPDEFLPERWDDATKEMRDSYLPFGGGNRACIGMHLAQIELRHALANFYRTFSSGVKPSTAQGFSVEEMKPMSYFIVTPKGGRFLVESR